MPLKSSLRTTLGLAGAQLLLSLSAASAGGISLDITLATPEVSPAYRPYMAVWLEGAEKQSLGTLAVWYDHRLRDNLGTTFLRELRQWWRAEGERLTLPVDGVSGPTRPPGTHRLQLGPDHPVLTGLLPGAYTLAVEVVREEGAREVLRLPFQWDGAAASPEAQASGTTEIAHVQLHAPAPEPQAQP